MVLKVVAEEAVFPLENAHLGQWARLPGRPETALPGSQLLFHNPAGPE